MIQTIPSFSLILKPVLNFVCFVTAWAITILFFWTILRQSRDAITQVKRLHQIPCSGCKFFTEEYYLKCTVRPTSALTEAAIDCPDFCSKYDEFLTRS